MPASAAILDRPLATTRRSAARPGAAPRVRPTHRAIAVHTVPASAVVVRPGYARPMYGRPASHNASRSRSGSRRPTMFSALVQVTALVGMAIGYAKVAFDIVFSARIGPVVSSLNSTQGVHSGDLMALPLLAMAAAAIAFAVCCWARYEAAAR